MDIPVPSPSPREPRPPRPPLAALAALALALAFALPLALGPTPALAAPAPVATPRPTRVLTSFLPVHSLATTVAGDRARVENWLPAGVDPHDFQFSPRDLRRLADADLLIVGGLGLEGWKEDRLREASGNATLRLVEAAAGLPAEALVQDPCGHDHGDDPHAHPPNPHFWLDPILAAHAATNIARALAVADPGGAAAYQANAGALVRRLHTLDRDFAAALTGARDRAFFTVHNAFPYLARRYQLRLAGVVQAGANEEPSARELAELSRVAREAGVKVLFNDGTVGRLTRRLAADLRLEIVNLETLETGALRPDAYEEGMRRNLRALANALAKGP
jgi:zinc transport system substrate-binding protein